MSSLKHASYKALVCVAAASLVLAGCNKKSTPAPNPTATPVTYPNVSGDYTGTLTDNLIGGGVTINTSGTLAQHNASAGGSVLFPQGAGTTSAAMSLVVTTTNTFTGSMVVDQGAGSPCTFSTNGTYTNDGSTSAVLAGSYTATTNCTGESGTFSLTQQCTDTPAVQTDARRMTFPAQC